MKQVAGRLRLEMAQFRELAAFVQFGSDLDKTTLAIIERGKRLTEILKQPQYEPMPLEEQVMVIFAGTNGYLDAIPVERVRQWEKEFLRFMATNYPEVGRDIAERKEITKETEEKLRRAIEEFNRGWLAG